MADKGVKFVRIHGRIVPIKTNPGDQKGKKVSGVKKPGIVPHVQKEAIGSAKKPYSRQFKLGAVSALGNVGGLALMLKGKSLASSGASLAASSVGAAAGMAGTYYQWKGAVQKGRKKGFASGVGEFVKQGLAGTAGLVAGAAVGMGAIKGFTPARQAVKNFLKSRRIAKIGLKIVK